MRKKLVIVVCILVVAGLAVPLINLVAGKPTGTALAAKKASDPELVRVTAVFEAKCAHCHVPAPPPRSMQSGRGVGLDRPRYHRGLRNMDLVAELFPGEGRRSPNPP